METVRIGIIGCGGMGRSHAAALQKIPGTAVAAAADTRADALGAFQSEFKVSRGYACFHELLKAGGIDAVVVCLPTHLHREAVTAAAGAKVHVFCEKPLARTMAEGAEMVAACADRGVLLQLGFVRRFDNCWNTARRIVQEGTLGTPVVWRDFRASFGPGRNPWYFDHAQGGGPFLDGMVHNFDFANHMFGRAVKAVSGLAKFKPSTAVDTGQAWVEYDSGHIMANFWSWGVPEKVNSFSGMDMIGPAGALVFPNTFNIMEFREQFDPERQSIFLLKREGGTVKPLPFAKNDMFQEQAGDFVRCVRTGTPPRAGGADGLAALKVALAVLQEEKL